MKSLKVGQMATEGSTSCVASVYYFKSKLSNLKGFKFLDVLLLHSIRLSLSICSQCLK